MAIRAIVVERVLTPVEEIRDAVLLLEDDRILAVGERDALTIPRGAQEFKAPNATLVPGFVDLHVHGAGGEDVMRATPEALGIVARTLANRGTTSFVATTVTASPDVLCKSAAGIADLVGSQSGKARPTGLSAELLGIHFEGPFISPARRGVHPEKWIAKPSAELLRRMLDAARGEARILTLAPELPGALELIEAGCSAGLVVSIGHTDATYEQAATAIARGARHAAHVFNAMRPFRHRDTGVIGAVLTFPEVMAELIADGVHVEAAAMKVLLKTKGAAGVTLVSDGTAATGMPDGSYKLGDFDVKVTGGVVRSSEGKLAGSALTLDAALRNVVALGIPLTQAVQMLTLNPAKELGLEKRKGVIAPGADADLVFLNCALQIERVITGGIGLD